MSKSNHILFLGAGASKDAGYPLTKDIFSELREHFSKSSTNNYAKQWGEFEKNITMLSEKFGVDYETQNPEIILTLPSLLNTSEDDFLGVAGKAWSQGNNQKLKQYEKIYDTKIWPTANNITRMFSMFINEYFTSKHIEDLSTVKYLSNMLSTATCVITTNWDALIERVLLNESRWFPSDGYGFERTMQKSGLRDPKPIKYPQSITKVLKLHGSIGWHQKNGTFYLRTDSYLQCLLNNNICDARAPNPGHGPHEDPVMLYPSYLKQLDNPILLTIWEQAQRVLGTASLVTIVGYSLPEADVAIRALLLPLRTNNATIKIVSPSEKNSDENKRWTGYFEGSGKTPEFFEVTAAQHFDSD